METFETYWGPRVAMHAALHGEIEYVIPDFPGRYKLLVVPQRERERNPLALPTP